MMVLDVTDSAGPRLESYVRDTWAPSLTRGVEVGYLYDLRSLTLGGMEAATAGTISRPASVESTTMAALAGSDEPRRLTGWDDADAHGR